MSYKVCIGNSRICYVYKDDKLISTAGYEKCEYIGFLRVILNNRNVSFLHIDCPTNKKSTCICNLYSSTNNFCVTLPSRVKIKAYITEKQFSKRRLLLFLNNPFIKNA